MLIPKANCMRIVSCALLICFTCLKPAMAQLKDTLFFYNSNVLIGELRAIKLGRADFDADGVGLVKIKNKEIKTIHAQSNEFRVETTNGAFLQGYLRPAGKDGRVTVYSLSDTQEIEVADIIRLSKYGRTWKNGLSGNVSTGYTYTKSSEIGRLNFDGSVRYVSPRAEIKLGVSTIWTSDSIEVSREREDVVFDYSYLFKNSWTIGLTLRYQRNLELGLERRLQEGIGIGHRVLVRTNQQGSLVSGLAINQELNLEGVSSKNTELVLQANYELFSFEGPNLSISVTQTGYFSVTEKGRARYDGNANLNWELISDFNLNLQFYHNYDSKSPETGEPNVDYGFVVGIGYKFD